MPHPTNAIKIRTDLGDGRQTLWRLNHPIPFETRSFRGPSVTGETLYVITSVCLPEMTRIQGCPECYLFAADENGEIVDWAERPGSQKDTTDHDLVLSSFLASFSE